MTKHNGRFLHSIRGKILVYTGSILLVILILVIALLVRDMYIHLLEDNETNILLNTAKVAQDIEAQNQHAVTYAKTLAMAQENGLFGKRAETVKYLYAVVESNPQFFDAYAIYEPNADGQDASFRDQPGSMASGRFNAVVNNEKGKYVLVHGVDMDTSLYYHGVKERFRATGKPHAMITEPYIYQGVMMVEQTYPIVIGGKFSGVTGVDRTLDRLSAYLRHIKPYKSADFILISRGGKIISATMDAKLNTRKIDQTPYKDILDYYYRNHGGQGIRTFEDATDRDMYFYTGALIKTGNWVLVMRVAQNEILQPIRATLLKVIVVSVIGVLILFAVLLWISNSIAAPITASARVAQRIAVGDLTSSIDSSSNDETGQLLAATKMMTENLNRLISQVQESCAQVTASSAEIAASARQLESNVAEQAASTTQVSATATEISATSQSLVQTMSDVSEVAMGAGVLADSGRSGLLTMQNAMRRLTGATDSISTELTMIHDRANNIGKIITTITKIANQTNLLSLNASIEAEKAGEIGRGFAVVAREIRRLADQTAVATLDIEEMVQEMQNAVGHGVKGVEQFSREVSNSLEEVDKISTQLDEIIEQVQTLTPRFADVNEGMQSQSFAAQQISEAIKQLSEAAHHTSQSVSEFHRVTAQLNEAAGSLQHEVSKFKVRS